MSENIAKALLTFASNQYEETYHLLKNEDKSRPKVLSVLGTSCFFTGRFEESFKLYSKLFVKKSIYEYELGSCSIENYDSFGRQIFKLLTSLDIHKLPLNINYKHKQSIESSDEQYPELDYIQGIMEDINKPSGKIEFENFISQIFKDIESNNDLKKEKAYFHLAELKFRQGEYFEAFKCYYDAIKIEPSKALYYGYAAQMLLRSGNKDYLAFMPLFTQRAIDLDPENARWHMLHGFACLGLSEKLHNDFKYQANFSLKTALKYCREDQISLKAAINEVYIN